MAKPSWVESNSFLTRTRQKTYQKAFFWGTEEIPALKDSGSHGRAVDLTVLSRNLLAQAQTK